MNITRLSVRILLGICRVLYNAQKNEFQHRKNASSGLGQKLKLKMAWSRKYVATISTVLEGTILMDVNNRLHPYVGDML